MTRAEYEACQARDEHGFRAAIEALTRRGLETGLANVDYKALVADEWRRGNIDDVIDREVDRAIGEVRDESSWLQAVVVAGLAREGAGARHHRGRARLPLRADEEGHRGPGDRPRQGDRQAHRARHHRYGRPGDAVHAGLPRPPLRHHRRPHRRRRRRQGIQRRSRQGRRPGLDRPGAGRGQRRHRRHGGAGGAPAARQHGLAHRPAHRRLDPRPPRLGGGRRRRPGADRQGHLGFPPRRAADRRRPR